MGQINDFTLRGIVPEHGQEPRKQDVNLIASTTFAKGTILGELIGASEVQLLTPGGTISGGTWTITFEGQTTAALDFDANAATVQAALEALSTIGTGNILVTGGPIDSGAITLTFRNQLGFQNVSQVTVDDGSLTGSTPSVTPSTTTAGSSGTRGTFKPYASGNTDGSQFPRAVLEFDCITDGSGNITLGGAVGGDEKQRTFKAVPAFFGGCTFRTSELTGFDQNALDVTAWRLIEGTVASGLVRMP